MVVRHKNFENRKLSSQDISKTNIFFYHTLGPKKLVVLPNKYTHTLVSRENDFGQKRQTLLHNYKL